MGSGHLFSTSSLSKQILRFGFCTCLDLCFPLVSDLLGQRDFIVQPFLYKMLIRVYLVPNFHAPLFLGVLVSSLLLFSDEVKYLF